MSAVRNPTNDFVGLFGYWTAMQLCDPSIRERKYSVLLKIAATAKSGLEQWAIGC